VSHTNTFACLLGLVASTMAGLASARDYVLIDSDKRPSDWKIDSQQLAIKTAKPFSIRLRTLHSGRQEGVSIIDIDTGAMTISVVPTRGMNVLRAVSGNVRLGWDSPVEAVVNPAYIELNSRAGLGWLEGFNELVARCGYEWVGHPGLDRGELLTLHGRASNIPATKVVLSIDDKAPYTIRLKGELKEQAFKKVNFSIATELTTEPGATYFAVHDTLTNHGDYPKEYQVLYHNNFGAPLLEKSARFAAPIAQVSPFNEKAQAELTDFRSYSGPTVGYDETVYNIIPYADSKGQTLAVLHNQAGTLGVRIDYDARQLPVFSLWKNTDTQQQGYVTGLEPGTSFSYNRSYQREVSGLNLVPTIGPQESRDFQLRYSLLANKSDVDLALKRVEEVQAGRKMEVLNAPLVTLPKK